MGQAIVPRLLAGGHEVAGWNRTKEKAKPLFKLGMTWADSPKQLAAQSEIVFSIVTDSEAVKSLALGENGIISGLRKGAIYLDMSTIDPDASRAVGAAFAKAGKKRDKNYEIVITPPMNMAPDTMQAAMQEYAALGVHRVVVNLGGQKPEQVDKRLPEIGALVKKAA